jgi:hypothetical protein
MTAFPKGQRIGKIDKSALAFAEVRRTRNEAYLTWVRSLPCSVPGCRRLASAHHLTCSPEPKARGARASDDWAVPLCYPHHQDGPESLHGSGNERLWWQRHGIDPLALCVGLRARWAAFQKGPAA